MINKPIPNRKKTVDPLYKNGGMTGAELKSEGK
jgi:hypothetical protein